MPKSIKIGNAIVCEHIAAGSGNRPILINVYSGDILIPELPASIFLAFFVEILSPPAQIGTAQGELRLGKNKIAEFRLEMGNDPNAKSGILALPAGVVKIDQECDISLWISAVDYKPTQALTKHIVMGQVGDYSL